MAQCSSPEELVAIQSVLHPIVAHAVTAGDAATRDWSTMSLPSMPGLAPRECIEEDESDNGASLMNTSDPNSDSGQGGNGRKPRASALARLNAAAQREASEGAAVSGDGKLPLAAWPTSFGAAVAGPITTAAPVSEMDDDKTESAAATEESGIAASAESLEAHDATERETKKPRHQDAHGEHALTHHTLASQGHLARLANLNSMTRTAKKHWHLPSPWKLTT